MSDKNSIKEKTAPVAEAVNLTYTVNGNKIFDNVSFKIPPGRSIGILGPSGSGKSSLIKLFNGIILPESGVLSVMGYSSGGDYEKIRSVSGVSTLSANLYPNLTVYENLLFFCKLNGMPESESTERTSFLLHKFDMWKYKDISFAAASTEIKKKTSILLALVNHPKIIFLDEPTVSFDTNSRNQTNKAVISLAEEENITVIMTGSDPDELPPCDYYVIIADGHVLAQGDVGALKKKSNISDRARIRVLDNSFAITGFDMTEVEKNVFEKDISSDMDMAELVKKAVYWGYNIIDASIYKSTLKDFYYKLIEN